MQRTRRAFIALGIAAASLIGAGCIPDSPQAAPNAGAHSCIGYVSHRGEHIDQIIRRLWADDPATADYLLAPDGPAWHESGCSPCASYSSQHDCARVFDRLHTAFGTLGYLSANADTALKSACPFILPQYSWSYAECNLKLARWKYDDARRAGGTGREPWRR